MAIQPNSVYFQSLQKADFNMKAGLTAGSLAIISLFVVRAITGHFDIGVTCFAAFTGGSLLAGGAFSYITRKKLLDERHLTKMPEEAKSRWKDLPRLLFSGLNEALVKALPYG